MVFGRGEMVFGRGDTASANVSRLRNQVTGVFACRLPRCRGRRIASRQAAPPPRSASYVQQGHTLALQARAAHVYLQFALSHVAR